MESHPLMLAAYQAVSAYLLTMVGPGRDKFRSYQLAIGAAENLREILTLHLKNLEAVSKRLRDSGAMLGAPEPEVVSGGVLEALKGKFGDSR